MSAPSEPFTFSDEYLRAVDLFIEFRLHVFIRALNQGLALNLTRPEAARIASLCVEQMATPVTAASTASDADATLKALMRHMTPGGSA